MDDANSTDESLDNESEFEQSEDSSFEENLSDTDNTDQVKNCWDDDNEMTTYNKWKWNSFIRNRVDR